MSVVPTMPTVEFDKSELPNCEEISRDDCFSSFLTDEDLTDLSLESTDGVNIRVNRRILAARSKVFRSMLLGKFSEAKKETIPLDYKGCVLKAIVEYVATDSATLLHSSDGTVDEDHIQTLVSLMEASIYFNLPKLCEKAFHYVVKSLQTQPSLSFAVLEACKHGNPAISKQLKQLVMTFLRTSSIEKMDISSVAILDASTLEEILKDDKIHADEYFLFKLVEKWAETHSEQVSAGADAGSHISANSSMALLKARDMIKKFIHLEWIEPDILSTKVASSDLVSQELLLETFKLQAFAAKEKHNVVFKRLRYTTVWNSSKSDTSAGSDTEHTGDMLNCKSMWSGVHQWTIEVTKACVYTWLGVASTSISLDKSKWLGGQEGGWMYGNNGSACHNGTNGVYDRIHPTFGEGSKVTFTLDLTPNQAQNGALSASVDGGNPFILFENMRDHLGEGNGSGFVPAVSLNNPGEIRLLYIERLE